MRSNFSFSLIYLLHFPLCASILPTVNFISTDIIFSLVLIIAQFFVALNILAWAALLSNLDPAPKQVHLVKYLHQGLLVQCLI